MQYTVVPFSLTTAPATFESLIEKVLRGLQWEKCVLYLDDVICFGPTFEETFESVQPNFERFRWANLKLKVSKCKFFQESVDFLGHVVSDRGISCDPKKIEAVVDWPKPTCVKEVRSFLGFCSYYRSFVKGFSSEAAPLHELTKKNVKFEWSDACDVAFNKLKARLVNSPVLGYPRNEGLFILDTDASLYGSGAVLSQIQDGQEKVIAYGSKSLSKTQRNYCTTMRELLACVVFMKQFHHYLWGRRFLLRTDHASLKWLVNFREPEGMLARWLAVLSNYDFEVQHRKGSLHSNADGLSRIPPRKCKRDDCEDCALKLQDCVCVVTRSQAKGHRAQEGGESMGLGKSQGDSSTKTESDLGGSRVPNNLSTKDNVNDGSNSASGGRVSQSDNPGSSMASRGFSVSSRFPDSNWVDRWSLDELKSFQCQDKDICRVLSLKSAQSDKPQKADVCRESNLFKCLCAQWSVLKVQDGILYREWLRDGVLTPVLQYVAPLALRNEIFYYLHSSRVGGHFGVRRTLCKLRSRFYWPGYKNDIERWCQTCKVCESFKSGHNPKRAPLKQQLAGSPLERIACDIMGPVVPSKNGNNYILVVQDYFTKFVEAYGIPDQTAQTVADCLVTQWFCRYGIPLVIHTDQGRNFESVLFKEVLQITRHR